MPIDNVVLKGPHYPFPRAEILRKMFSECVTDYYTKATLGKAFEARGLLLTGRSRVGKTIEIENLIADFNASGTLMPNGKRAKFVSTKLSAKMTPKELPELALEALDYPAMKRATENEMWRRFHQQAELQGVVGIHFDEAQHAFTGTGNSANNIALNAWKRILKDSNHPMMIILSGVPILADHLEKDMKGEDRLQLRYLLKAMHFETINLRKDLDELNCLVYSYAEKAGVNFDHLSTVDFLERLAHASCYRWGLVIQMVIEALSACVKEKQVDVAVSHFEAAFKYIYGQSSGYTPFTTPDFLNAFDPDNLVGLLDRSK